MQWKVEITSPADEAYRALKQEFDKEVVKKETFEFTSRAGKKFTKERAVIDDDASLKFRLCLKAVQTMLPETGDVKVTIQGNEQTVGLELVRF